MRAAQQPKIANWFLRHFGSSPNNDAVIGDLTERYREGRYAISSHLGIFNFIAALWASTGITTISILSGGGFFTSGEQGDSPERKLAAV